MKTKIRVYIPEFDYYIESNIDELNDKDLKLQQEILSDLMKVEYLKIESGMSMVYLYPDLLKKSVISIVKI